MSTIICKTVEESELLKKAAYKYTKEFIYAATDNGPTLHLPFPAEYRFEPCFLPKKFESNAERVEKFKVRRDDIWISSYPKSGSTWLYNIVWKLKNNLNTSNTPMNNSASLFLDWPFLFQMGDSENSKQTISFLDNAIDRIDIAESPRVIKSHLPANLLPKDIWTVQPKIIYIARNTKDVAVSFYHMHRNGAANYTGTLDEFLELFLNDFVIYAPIHKHITNFWDIRNLNYVLFITYEELSVNRFTTVKKISNFLNCNYSDQQLYELSEHVSFENMKMLMKSGRETMFGDKRPDPDYRYTHLFLYL